MFQTIKYMFGIYCFSILIHSFDIAMAHNETAAANSRNVILQKFPIKVSQGVAVDENYFYAISNTQISKCAKESGKVISVWKADRKTKAQAHFKHLNSGTVVGDKLYCAHSRFPIGANNCTVEIFNVTGEALEHEKTIKMPANHGSLTWIDQHSDGSWWMCYAVYGKGKNSKTKLVKYRYEHGIFTEESAWFFPDELISKWGTMSCSGGSWGADGHLYVTGHDQAEVYLLQINDAGKLNYIRTEKGLGIYGQAIAWDRTSIKPVLWGIVKNKHVSLTSIPAKK